MKNIRPAMIFALALLFCGCAVLTLLILPSPAKPADTDSLLSFEPRGGERICYGFSGRGRELAAWRFGSGENVLVLTFGLHGYEDGFPRDGTCLVYTANRLMEALGRWDISGWTVYVLPCCNPDGLINGFSNNGPGRCTTAVFLENGELSFGKGADINRCFPVGWERLSDQRNFNGSAPLACPEASALSEFVSAVKGGGLNFCIDVHGWYGQVLTSGGRQSPLFEIFSSRFPENTWADLSTGTGYFTAYAAVMGFESCLFEFPPECESFAEFVSGDMADRFILGVKALVNG